MSESTDTTTKTDESGIFACSSCGHLIRNGDSDSVAVCNRTDACGVLFDDERVELGTELRVRHIGNWKTGTVRKVGRTRITLAVPFQNDERGTMTTHRNFAELRVAR